MCANVEYKLGSELTEADYILEHSFWIGVHPRLTQKDREFIVGLFDKYFNA
jgi:dTDP-4-amino-4,6-dideoxygalactose transaminase